MKYAIAALLLSTVTANAADLTLNDLPGILAKLRGCTETRSVFGGVKQECRIKSEDLWASIGSDGALTLFKKRPWGDTTYARGLSVNELLRDFAAKINSDRDEQKQMLDALGPYLETQ